MYKFYYCLDVVSGYPGGSKRQAEVILKLPSRENLITEGNSAKMSNQHLKTGFLSWKNNNWCGQQQIQLNVDIKLLRFCRSKLRSLKMILKG